MTTKQLQHLLGYLGYALTPDGVSGPRTQAAVRQFQTAQGLDPDGIPGPRTQAALKQAVCREEDAPQEPAFWQDIRYFTREEFRCTCGGRYCGGFPVEPEEGLVRALDAIRARFAVPFTPNSAIRCPRRNAEVGGTGDSQHLLGRGADITVPGTDPQTLADFAETLLPDTGGIGIYPWGIHIDTRPRKARWRG